MSPAEQKEYRRRWYQKHKERILCKQRIAYAIDPSLIKAKNAASRKRNRDKIRERDRLYRASMSKEARERLNRMARERIARNPEKRRKVARESARRKRASPAGKLEHRIAVAVSSALRGEKRGRSWKRLLGYSVEELKGHIESLFRDGMSWREFAAGKIHIDHKIPKSKFAYTTPEDIEFRRCWALENLQPMWANENLSKRDRVLGPSQIALGL